MLHVSSSFSRFLDQSDNRLAQFLNRALWYQGSRYAHRNLWAKLMIKDDDVNYLTLRDDKTISYLPKGKEHVVTEDGRWARDSRQNGRPAAIIKKVLTKNALKLFKDSEFEAFVNAYKSECDKEAKTFVIKDNVDIPDVYCMSREYGGGTLGDSCMNGDSDLLDIYKYCPHLRILCLMNNEDKLAGRALLWSLPDGNTLVDRMYVAQDHYYDMFIEYAEKNGFMYKKKYKTYQDGMEFILNGEVVERSYTIETRTDFTRFPYIDTFRFGCDGWLSNDDNSSYSYEYNCTSGGREGDNRVECAKTGEWIDEDDARYIERGQYSGYHLHCDYTVYCETDQYYYYEDDDNIVEVGDCWYRIDDSDIVEINGDWYRTDDEDVRYSEGDGEWYMREDCEYSDFHNDYIRGEDCVYSNHHESYIRDTEAYKVAGEYFHESVVNKVA